MKYPWAVPGAKVVCVDASTVPGEIWKNGDCPVKGATYTISDVWVDNSGSLVLEFVEKQRSLKSEQAFGYRVGYNVRRFRPLITQADDVAKFAHLLTTTKEKVDA
jgi:hypothetical protein